MEPALTTCQCEHAAHLDGVLTPNGNPGHSYGVRFNAGYIRTVVTIYGAFEVCKDCAADCLAQEGA